MSDKIKLLPCPFCGGENVFRAAGDLGGYHIFCDDCFAESGTGETEEEAAEIWNHRVAAPAAPVAQEPAGLEQRATEAYALLRRVYDSGFDDDCVDAVGDWLNEHHTSPAAEQPDTGHELFAELYQILGALGASEAVLDQVLAASQGEPLPHASLLPYAAEQPADTAMQGVLELLRERRELDGDARYLFGDDRVWAEKADAFLVSTAAEQPTGTASDQYRAELYDEVWGKARSMGYGNVTDALAELERLKAAEQQDAWTPSGADYDRNIHRNPDAAAWADLFVATFPALADKRDLMLGWFANAMMAMHDFLKAEQPDAVAVPRELLDSAARSCANGWVDYHTARELRALLSKEGAE